MLPATFRPETRITDIRDWFATEADRARGLVGPLRTVAERRRLGR